MKKLIMICCVFFAVSCSVNNEDDLNRFEIQKLYQLYVDDFIANDFESIACLLKSLDIFVTISNSTAHLAGSLGVRTILIKPENYALFHYWNQKKNKTPILVGGTGLYFKAILNGLAKIPVIPVKYRNKIR